MNTSRKRIEPMPVSDSVAAPRPKHHRSEPCRDRLPTWSWPAASIAILMCLGGCQPPDPCGPAEPAGVTVVLTFDDGPLAADVELWAAPPDPRELLGPLEQILAALAERDICGVFFVEGPGDAANAATFRDVFADGLELIHTGGHRVGYHAFNHARSIWVQPLGFPPVTQLAMRADLDQLELYLALQLADRGLAPADVLTAVFRQPYGGAGLSRAPAATVSAARGWTYRGFMIDSVDWTDHADADPFLVDQLPLTPADERVAFVRRRLREGALRNGERAVVDVLFHVNHFTAEHLGDWIDELSVSFTAIGRGPVQFAVPACYVEESDLSVDLSAITAR